MALGQPQPQLAAGGLAAAGTASVGAAEVTIQEAELEGLPVLSILHQVKVLLLTR